MTVSNINYPYNQSLKGVKSLQFIRTEVDICLHFSYVNVVNFK